MAQSKSIRLWVLRGIALCLMLATGYIAWYTMESGKPRDFWQDKLATRANLQKFDGVFEDQNGKQVKLSEFAGKNAIATFVFKNCTMVCPTIMNDLRLFDKDYPDFKAKGNFLVFTFEDHRGHADDLKDFLKKYSVDGNQWHVLTSDAATIKRLADTYDLQYQKEADGKVIYAHSNVFLVADTKGKIRREFRGIENNKARFFDEIKKFL
ncbi:MAG TPA: SCO family protein [Turneriella sp.]|nr:SCO family protein [Turneriella sp.]